MSEEKTCPACKCVDNVKGFLAKEHTPMERVMMTGGIFLAGLIVGSVVVAVKKK